MDIKQLNRSEIQIMEYLWKLEMGFMKDIVEKFPEPRPAYTTISTILTRMCAKNYIGFNKLGRDKEYFPILQKKDYFSMQIKTMITHFFNDSAGQFASFFTNNTNLSIDELNELKEIVDKQISNKKRRKK